MLLRIYNTLIGRIIKPLFTNKTILFVTQSGIKNININKYSQFFIYIIMIWLGVTINQSLNHDKIILAKNEKISKLESINRYFENELSSLNEEFTKINEYIKIAPDLKHLVSSKTQIKEEVKLPKSIKKDDLISFSKKNLEQLIAINNNSKTIKSYADNRINQIQGAINITGLDTNKMPRKDFLNKAFYFNNENLDISKYKDHHMQPQGGPVSENEDINNEVNKYMLKYDINRSIKKINFKNKIDHLIYLENLISTLPLNRPMKNYYISSSFGYRQDPITKRRAMHKGQDYAGPLGEKIISPSKGKVILAGKFYQYGNAIVIDHGFGVTTRYGHLSKINVKKGQLVSPGQEIGVQGNTGRSTGHHLHYEVRYKNKALNPRKFIKAGDALYESQYIES
tara:strand:- start:1864 stop:3054 length:1191 start_codon:yes stop_codon:yes gene_type:complete